MNPFTDDQFIKRGQRASNYNGSVPRSREGPDIQEQFNAIDDERESSVGGNRVNSGDFEDQENNSMVMNSVGGGLLQKTHTTFSVNMAASYDEFGEHISICNKDFKEQIMKKVQMIKLKDTSSLNKRVSNQIFLLDF